MTNENTKKPITYIMTYRGVQDYELGFHEGKNGRDVFIAGDEIPPAKYLGEIYLYGEKYVSEEKTSKIFKDSENNHSNLMDKIDEMYVYLGAKGAGPGFEYIKNAMEKNGKTKITVVACDCGAEEKTNFAKQNHTPILWSECGGRKTLRGIVTKILI